MNIFLKKIIKLSVLSCVLLSNDNLYAKNVLVINEYHRPKNHYRYQRNRPIIEIKKDCRSQVKNLKFPEEGRAFFRRFAWGFVLGTVVWLNIIYSKNQIISGCKQFYGGIWRAIKSL